MNISSLADLVSIAHDDSPDSRNMLVESINSICLSSGKEMSQREKSLIYEIVSQLLQVVETQVRQRLATSLADQDDVPKELVMVLANDVIDVAYPVIIKSKVLEDQDLIQLILEKAEHHQIAVSERDDISEDVSETLVETQNVKVITSLLHNETAHIHIDTVDKLVDDSASVIDYRLGLINRKELHQDMAKRMYSWVGDALKEHLEDRFSEADMNIELDQAVTEAVESALSEDIFTDEDGLDQIFDDYNNGGYRPAPRVLILALRDGDIFKFEEIFRDFVNMDNSSVTRLLYDTAPQSLAIACKASGMGHQDFSDVLCLLKNNANPGVFAGDPAYKKTMDYFDRMNAKGAIKVLDSWRESPSGSWGV